MSNHPVRPARADDRMTGVERWLRSPIRFAALVVGAVVVATAATTPTEVELQRAWAVGGDETAIVVRQAAFWSAWALAAPPLVALAVKIARRVRAWPLALVCHVPIAGAVGALFLVLDNELVEWVQGPERTEDVREFVEARESADREGRGGDWRRGRDGDRDRARGPRDDRPRDGAVGAETPGADVASAALEASQGQDREDRSRQDQEADRGDGAEQEGSESEDARREDRRRRRDEWRRRRGSRPRRDFMPVTGDLVADFERRWSLRVPRYALIYFALIGIGLGVRSFLVGRSREREAVALERRATQLEADLTEAKLSALQGQLHPHFLFNALHSIGGLIRTDKPTEALTALASIGDLLRTSLDAGGEQFVPLGREVELIERYLEVETLRLGDRLQVTFDVPDALTEAEVPAFIAQPLAENAVKHAIAPRTSGGAVTIRARTDGANHLVIDVEDDGPGFQPDGREGVGLPHIRSRLAALFDDDASLEMTTLDSGGTRARLRLPLDDLVTGDASGSDTQAGGAA